MKALVLAAGLGERLRPLTDRTPKPLLEVGGRPLIHYALLMLRRYGVTRVAINLHHLGDQLRAALGDGSALGVEISYAPEPTLLGSGGPIAGLGDFFGDEPFVVMNSDTIIDPDFARMLEFHRTRGALATFLLRPIPAPEAYSEVVIDPAGRIHCIRLLADRPGGTIRTYRHPSGPGPGPASPLMYCGVSICEPGARNLAHRPPPFGLMGDLFAPALESGHPLFGFVYDGYFRTVDDLTSYHALQREFASAPAHLSYLD